MLIILQNEVTILIYVNIFVLILYSFLIGDVIVDINGTCVLGHTHADVVQMFQLVPVNQYVNMTLCRGYPLPDESEDPVVDIVTATPVLNGQPVTKEIPVYSVRI